MIKVTRKVQFTRRADRSRKMTVVDGSSSAHVPRGRVPRISRLMALAIHFDRLIREGKVADQSELARLAHVTQPRMTQIMNLNHLAPDIQEAILHRPPVVEGCDPVNERDLRPIARLMDWEKQRTAWAQVARSTDWDQSHP